MAQITGIKLTCSQTRGKTSENIMVFDIECLVLAQRRAYRTPICQEVPDWPVPAVREESDPFYPSWRKKTSFCFHPCLTNCFFPSFLLFDNSASQKLRQRRKQLVLLYNQLPPNQLFPTKGKQKIEQYFVASLGQRASSDMVRRFIYFV